MTQVYERDPLVRYVATGIFAAAIAGVGAAMEGVTSSPEMKGAALLWLPATLQLMAGVWLGPTRGFVAGAVGAQAAGILAYGGWAPSDWIMNFVAGGFANAWLPAVLFLLFAIEPDLDAQAQRKPPGLVMILLLMIAAVLFAFLQRPIFAAIGLGSSGPIGYALPLGLVVLVPLLTGLRYNRQFLLALIIVTLCSFISAAIGVVGAIVAGQTLVGAITTVGIGWFLGDIVAAIVGLYALATLTPWARERGLAPVTRSSPI
jgi:hypothetical protein